MGPWRELGGWDAAAAVSPSVVSDSLRPRGLEPALQAPLSMGFPQQEHWNELLFPSPGDLPDPGIEPMSLALADGSLPLSHLGSPISVTKGCSNFLYP